MLRARPLIWRSYQYHAALRRISIEEKCDDVYPFTDMTTEDCKGTCGGACGRIEVHDLICQHLHSNVNVFSECLEYLKDVAVSDLALSSEYVLTRRKARRAVVANFVESVD